MPLWLDVFLYSMLFIMGTLFGSFFTLASYRIPRKLDIVKTRSFCPKCEHKLNFFDLIPVFSYIFNGGKCKYCKNKISSRYILFEIFNGIVFVILYKIFGISYYFIFSIIIYIALFLNTSVYIMNKKYILEKIEKLNNKKGIFVTELIIALFMFLTIMSISYITSKNTVNQQVNTIAENNAYLLAANNTEIALGTNYDDLYSFSKSEQINGIVYNISVEVIKYSDIDFSKKDYIKTLNTKVEYMLDGVPYEYNISTIKKKVLK